MAANFSRVDVHFTRSNRELLNKLKEEARIRTGRSVSMSRLVNEIVGEYFSKEEIIPCIAVDSTQDTSRESSHE